MCNLAPIFKDILVEIDSLKGPLCTKEANEAATEDIRDILKHPLGIKDMQSLSAEAINMYSDIPTEYR